MEIGPVIVAPAFVPILQQNLGLPSNDNSSSGYDAPHQWHAASFLTGLPYTLRLVQPLTFKTTGAPLTAALSCSVYSNIAGLPGISLGLANNSHSDALTTTPSPLQWAFTGTPLLPATRYWIVWRIAAVTGDGWRYDLKTGSTENTASSADGLSWVIKDANEQMTMQLYS